MGLAIDVILYVPAVLVVFLASTVAFDVVHWLLHRAMDSRFALLRWAGSMHATHHRFLGRDLRVDTDLIPANLRNHVVPEFLTQAAFSALMLLVVPWPVVAGVFALQLVVFGLILRARGLDVNHRGTEKLRAYRPLYFCVPEYHALHHVHPDAHFSSWIKTLDHLLGTGTSLVGRRIAWIGPPTAAGTVLARALRDAGVEAIHGEHAPSAEIPPEVAAAEIVIVGDGADETGKGRDAALSSFVAEAEKRRVPPEVWTFGVDAKLAREGAVIHRALLPAPDPVNDDAGRAWVRGVRRGYNVVPSAAGLGGLAQAWQYRGATQ